MEFRYEYLLGVTIRRDEYFYRVAWQERIFRIQGIERKDALKIKNVK